MAEIETSDSSPPGSSGFSRFIKLAMWCCFGVWLFSFLGRHFFLAELVCNFRPQLFAAFLVSLLLTRYTRASWLLFTCLFLGTIWTGWDVGQVYLPAQQPPAGETRLRIMSMNVLATNTDFRASIDEIRTHDPDVVVVVEYANQWHNAFETLHESYPHRHLEPRWHGYGIAVFSKLPLESAQTIQLTETEIDNPAIAIELSIDDQPLRVIAAHVMSPTNRMRLDLRNRQFRDLANRVNQKSLPTILLGDMNCSVSSTYLEELLGKTQLRDSRAGFGIQPTWPNQFPPLSIAIDHVLVSDSIHVHDRQIGNAGSSDHRPVIVDVSFSQQ